ncbi:murein L,D-transpeptidase family protein [Prosthecobacter sp.]|uniref:L,D-transpeptidase family protein n=1 Tax=Prosthecobacter sp. TaxID=1965333 RepID=UPI001DF4579C|nr:murein L,D-transpeptidase family protein [Prosthecobacter sp.]MCB1277347.1 murein L,D-transpeptidase [Prosthecobacter sp.]
MRARSLLLVVALVAACLLVVRAGSPIVIYSWLNIAMQQLTQDHLALPYTPPPQPDQWKPMTAAERLSNVRSRLLPKLHDELAARQLKLGQSAFIRIFKETRELELWLQTRNGWKLFRNYPIATFSGTLGPKTKEGDMQAPEGFYRVTARQLNLASSYHLSFNIGYPNAYDLAHQRTGSLIMVHGSTVSIGCFAMTDPLIEEIYLVVEAALKDTDTVPVHIFPFRMTDERMQKEQTSPHLDFWQNLRPVHDLFDKERRVPTIIVENGRYHAR